MLLVESTDDALRLCQQFRENDPEQKQNKGTSEQFVCG